MTDSKNNPGLHRLYVHTAMQHLVQLKKAIKRLERSNINWHGPVNALHIERAKLLNENPAYQEAAWRLLAGQIAIESSNESGGTVNKILDNLTDTIIPEPVARIGDVLPNKSENK